MSNFSTLSQYPAYRIVLVRDPSQCLARSSDGVVDIADVHSGDERQLWEINHQDDGKIVISAYNRCVPQLSLTYVGGPGPQSGADITTQRFDFEPTEWRHENGLIRVARQHPDNLVISYRVVKSYSLRRLALLSQEDSTGFPLKFSLKRVRGLD